MPCDRARGLRVARPRHREGRRPARQGLGAGAHLAPVLPGPHEGRGRDYRDPEVLPQPGFGAQEMKWIDTREIAIALAEKHPDVDPERVNFVDLHRMVLALEGFDDDPKRSGEKILEAIQATWIEEAG